MERDATVVPTRLNTGASAILLAAANAVRKVIIGGHMVHLRRRLVVPLAPRLAAVDRDDGSLVARERNDLRVVRIDVDSLVIVAAG